MEARGKRERKIERFSANWSIQDSIKFNHKTTIIKLPTMINDSLQLSRIEGKCLAFSKLAII